MPDERRSLYYRHRETDPIWFLDTSDVQNEKEATIMNENHTEFSFNSLEVQLLIAEEQLREVRRLIKMREESLARLANNEETLCQKVNDLNKLRDQLGKFGRNDLFTT